MHMYTIVGSMQIATSKRERVSGRAVGDRSVRSVLVDLRLFAFW